MKRSDKILFVEIGLSNKFKKRILHAMNEEFGISLEKWGVSLSDAQKEKVMEASIQQLQNKVSLIAGNEWKLGERKIGVVVKTERVGYREVRLPADDVKNYSVSFARIQNDWNVIHEPTQDAVRIQEFREYFLKEIEKWARTAVFYGVSSYT